jgi:hypothetical protein
MKTKINSITLLFFFAASVLSPVALHAGSGSAKHAKDTLTCLEVSGQVAVSRPGDKGVFMVKLYKDNNAVDSIWVGPKKEFKFRLEKNSNYTVRISRQGYADRAVWVDTELPPGVDYNPVFRFHFETLLMERSAVKNTDVLDFPIALVYYDEGKGWFDYSRKYTSKIKTAIAGNGTF